MTSTPAGSYGRHSLSTAFLQAYVDQEIASVIDLSPESLNTLNELAAAINDDPAFFTTMATANTGLQTNIDNLAAVATTARGDLQTLLQNAIDAVQADVNTNEADADAAFTAETSARTAALNALEATLLASIATLQSDVDTNETDSDAAETALSGRLDTLEADPTTAAAVTAVQTDVDANETARKAVIDIESNITSVKNAVRGTSIAVGNNITLNPASGGRVEIEGDLLLDNTTDVIDGAGVTLTSFTNINAYDGRINGLEADPITAAAVAAVQADVDQNESDADAAIAAVQADVDQNEADADAAIATEKARIDAILLSSDADKDTFAEIVALINSVDTANDTAFAGYVTSNDAAVAALQADVNQNETDADAADTALSNRLDTLEADPTTATALAAVQADVDQNEADADAADTALGNRITVLEADPTTAAAVAAVQADVDQNESDADAAIAAENTAMLAAVAAVQADVDQNESDADTALALKAALTGANFTGDILLKKSDGSSVDLEFSRTDHADMNTVFKIGASYVDINKECLVISGGGQPIAYFDERQRVSIGKTDPDHVLDVGGDGKFSTNLTVGGAVNLTLTNAADDAAAASAGVAVGQLYRNGSVVMIRVS